MIRHASAVVVALVLNVTPLFGQATRTPATDLTVRAAAAEVHKFPTVASAVIAKAPAGTVLEIRRNLGSWVEVTWPGSDAGIAFVHVSTGTIAPRTAAMAANGAQDAVAQIAAVAEAATAATTANTGVRAGGPAGATRYASQASYVSLPPRRIGMGALMNGTNVSAPRFGASARMWWHNRLGVQFHASRPDFESADGQQVPATQFSPSVLYSLPDALSNSVWLRPYVGGGPRIYRANLMNRLGYEAFGGVETTLAGMPQFAISTEVGYRWKRPSFDGFQPREIGFSLSGHWYVK